MAEQYSIVYIYHTIFIHSSVNGHILTHIYRIQKNFTEEFIYRATVEKQTQRTDLWTWAEERMRCMERVTWKLTLPYVRQIANGNLLYGSGNLNRGSVSTHRGGMEREMGGRLKREGIYLYLWLIHVEIRQKTAKFCKAIIL